MKQKKEKIFKEDNLSKNKKTSNRNLAGVLAIVIVLMLLGGLLVMLNGGNADWRSLVNSVKRKILSSNSTTISSIQVDPGQKQTFTPYNSGLICVWQKGIQFYNIQGTKEWDIPASFSVPNIKINGKYFLISDSLTKSIYAYSGQNLLWNKTLDGEILACSINENGYVGVIYKGEKSRLVAEVYDKSGESKMTRYYSNNYAIDILVSPNNKYAAIGEMDVNGLKSSAGAGIIPIGTELYSGSFDEDSVFGSMAYFDKDLILVLNNKILKVEADGTKSTIIDISQDHVTNVNINSGKYIVIVEKSNQFLNSANKLILLNKKGNESGNYEISGRVADIDSERDIIALNLESKVVFINSFGKEISQFNPKREVDHVELFNDGTHAAVIYPDHVDIINIY